MNPEELSKRFGNKISDQELKFLLKYTIPFIPITSESLEYAKKVFIEFVSERVYFFKPVRLTNFELDFMPVAEKFKWSNDFIESILDTSAYVLGRSGKFKQDCYVFLSYQEGFLFFNVKGLDTTIKNKLIFLLAPRIQWLLKHQNEYESAIMNMLKQKRIVLLKGKEYCFLRSHILVEGNERPILKKEVQTLFNLGMDELITGDEIVIRTKNFKYFNLKLVEI